MEEVIKNRAEDVLASVYQRTQGLGVITEEPAVLRFSSDVYRNLDPDPPLGDSKRKDGASRRVQA
jgi:hypothetical protein